MYTFAVVTCLLGVAVAAPYGSLGYAAIDSVSIPNYGFSYAVNDPITGDNKAQHEVRNGDVVKGSYSLTEPDGTIRVVDYTADGVSGFNAVVKNIGTAVHPQTIVAKPVIAAPVLSAPVLAPAYSSINVGLGHGIGLGWGGIGLGSGLGWGHGGWGHGGWGQGSWGNNGWGHGGWGH